MKSSDSRAVPIAESGKERAEIRQAAEGLFDCDDMSRRMQPDMEESDGNRATRGVSASAGRGISDVVPQPELGLPAQRRIGRGAADRASARFVGTIVSRPELGRIVGSEDEHEWIGTPVEMLDALLNRPAPLSPMVFIQSDGESRQPERKRIN